MTPAELNERVAREVMGWSWLDYEEDAWVRPDGLVIKLDRFAPATFIADAWLVIDRMRELGFDVCVNTLPPEGFTSGRTEPWHFSMRTKQREVFHGWAETAPEAICLAALAALEAK